MAKISACAVKIWPKICKLSKITILSHEIVAAEKMLIPDFTPEVEILPFLCMLNYKWSITRENVSWLGNWGLRIDWATLRAIFSHIFWNRKMIT